MRRRAATTDQPVDVEEADHYVRQLSLDGPVEPPPPARRGTIVGDGFGDGFGDFARPFFDVYCLSQQYGMYLLLGLERIAFSSAEALFLAFCTPVGACIQSTIIGKILLLLQRAATLQTKQ